MSKKLVKYRLVYEFGNNNKYLTKHDDWICSYLTQEEIDKLTDSWDNCYTTYNALKEDANELPYVSIRKGLFSERIYIHFPCNMEPYWIRNNDSKYLPIRTHLQVEDYNPTITNLASNISAEKFLEYLRDKGFKGELKL